MKKSYLLLSLLLALPAPATAQKGLLEGLKVVRACTGDVERPCWRILPGEGQITACVHENATLRR
jgi:hypothetical protein